MRLSDKIHYINKVAPFSKVLYEIKGIAIDSTQQIFCPYHDDINEKSARVYINNKQDGSDGLFCFKCGNFTAFKVVQEHFGGNIPETLKWFEDNYDIKVNDMSSGFNAREDKRIAKLVYKCKQHSRQVPWSGKDVNRLALLLKKYGEDDLTTIRLGSLDSKLSERK